MEEKILDILEELCDDDIVKSNPDVELFDSGLLDSLAFTELLIDLEDAFGIVIAPSEVEREDINTPKKIVDLVRSRG